MEKRGDSLLTWTAFLRVLRQVEEDTQAQQSPHDEDAWKEELSKEKETDKHGHG